MKKLTPLRIVVIYISAYIVWIVGTDMLVTNIPMSDDVRMKISMAKGIFSVLVSTFFLYWIIFKYTLQLKQAEQSLMEEKKKSEAIISSMGDGIAVLDNNYSILYQNDVHVGMVGKHLREKCYQAYHLRSKVCDGCPVVMSFKDGGIHQSDRIVERDGKRLYFETTAAPIRDAEGKITGGVEIVREVTAKKKMEEAIAQSEQHYRMLFEESPISIWEEDFSEAKNKLDSLREKGITDFRSYFAKDPEEKAALVSLITVTNVNEESLRLFKASSKKELRESWKTIQTSRSIDEITNGLSVLYEGGSFEAEYQLKTVTGDYLSLYHKWEVINAYVNPWANVLISRIDSTKLKQAEDFVRNILESVDEGFIVIDKNLNIKSANAAYLRMIGKAEKEVLGQKCHEVSHKKAKPCFQDGIDCPVMKTYESGKSHRALHEHKGEDNTSVFTELKSYPMRDANGKVISVIETVIDITEKKKLEEELVKTQKLESIGLLAGGIAHDFNNLLTGIKGYISLIKVKTDSGAEKYVEDAEKAIDQAKSLAQQLLTFSKGGEPVKKPIHILTAVKEALRFGLSGRNIHHEIVVDDDLPAVEADDGQLRQVVQNIVINAAEAMPQGGVVHVSLRNVNVAEDTINLTHGDYVSIEIKDSGMGIANNHLQSIFDPYFTTKQKGSGLGLATSFSIVKKHGGTIEVESEIGKGSHFKILDHVHLEWVKVRRLTHITRSG